MDTLDPKLDIVFKLLFGSPKGREACIALLDAVLDPASPIEDIVVLDPAIPKAAVSDKGIVLDLRVRLRNGTEVDIEMQSTARPGFRRRTLYYWASMFCKQLERGEPYSKLEPAVVIVFTDYREMIAKRLHSIIHTLEAHDHERFSDVFEVHLIELPKTADPDALKESRVAVQRWARFLAATRTPSDAISPRRTRW